MVGVRGFGLAGFQYMRMLFGAQTAKPDIHIAYGPGVFKDPDYANVGGVCLFWMRRVMEGDVKFASVCITNPCAVSTAVLPHELVAKIDQVNIDLFPA